MRITIETAEEESVKHYPSGEVVVKVKKEDFLPLKNIILEAMKDPEDYDAERDGDQVVDTEPIEDDDERWDYEERSDEFLL